MLSWEEGERGLINDGGDETGTGTGKEGGWVKLQRMIDSIPDSRVPLVLPLCCACVRPLSAHHAFLLSFDFTPPKLNPFY